MPQTKTIMSISKLLKEMTPDDIKAALPMFFDNMRYVGIVKDCINSSARAKIGDPRDLMCNDLEKEGYIRWSITKSDEDYNVYLLTKKSIEALIAIKAN